MTGASDWVLAAPARPYRALDDRASAAHMQGFDDAIANQLRLEREYADWGESDPYVFEELEQLYRATGDAARAEGYGERLRAARQRERQ